jgi:hypothetical protein
LEQTILNGEPILRRGFWRGCQPSAVPCKHLKPLSAMV